NKRLFVNGSAFSASALTSRSRSSKNSFMKIASQYETPRTILECTHQQKPRRRLFTEHPQGPKRPPGLPISHHAGRRLVPAEVRSHVGATLAAGRAYEPRLEIGKPRLIWPGISADRDRVAAAVVGAVDQEAARARRRACR